MEPVKIILPSIEISLIEKQEKCNFYKKEMNATSENWLKEIYSFLLQWLDEGETIETKTSGSTGEPKTILINKSTLIFSAKQTSDYFGFRKNEKWLLCLPCNFIGGKMMLVRAILNEAELFAVEPKIDLTFLKGEFDFAAMIPLQAEKYLTGNFKVKKIIIGGTSVPKLLEDKLKLEKRTDFFATYGMTETVSHIALRKVNGMDTSDYFAPLKNILLGKDERGCLTIYNKNYSEHVIVTNDLVEFNSKNEFKIIGRWDNIINYGGLKIIPEEIEKTVNLLIPNRILICGLPDDNTYEKPVLFIEGIKWDNSTLYLFEKSLNDKLEKNKIPKEIIFIDSFIETGNGKINRKATKENYLKNLRSNL